MRQYFFVGYLVDGKPMLHLDVYLDQNIFSVYENDLCVFRGTHSNVVNFINEWHNKYKPLMNMFVLKGLNVEYNQCIK